MRLVLKYPAQPARILARSANIILRKVMSRDSEKNSGESVIRKIIKSLKVFLILVSFPHFAMVNIISLLTRLTFLGVDMF